MTVKTIIAIATILSLPSISAEISGWFVGVPRGGGRRGDRRMVTKDCRGESKYLFPDADSNVQHAYAHMNYDRDNERNIKSTTRKERATSTSDEEYDEDHFFHALLHNNDRNNHVVQEADGVRKNRSETVTYGIREIIEASALME